MTDHITLDSYERAERELARTEGRRGFRIHATVYAVVVPILILVNVFAVSDFYWFPFPLVGWGFGLTMHYLFGVRRAEDEARAHQVRVEERVRRAA